MDRGRWTADEFSPDDLAPESGTLPTPALAEARDDGQAAPALVVRVRLAGLHVEWAVVPYLDHERLIACQQAEGDRGPLEEHNGAPRLADTARMLEFYGVTGQRREVLMALCAEARKRGWWHQFSGAIPAWFEVYVGLEGEVSEIRSYQSEAIDGRLQTEAYIRALMLADVEVPTQEELDRRVAVRLKRQEQMMGEDGPKMWVVLNEGTLRRTVGGAVTMREQLEHLIGISRSNRTVIQVLTFAAGAHPGMDGSFEILRFPEPADPDAVYVQYRRGSIYLEENADVTAYADLFDHLRARALGPDESRSLMERMAQELT